MTYNVGSVDDYVAALPQDRREAFARLREVVRLNLPVGFEETMAYGMPAYVVPHSLYPPGYHCDPKQALPYINIASQKHYIALYHMGIYANPELLDWFVGEYGARVSTKLDMGKSCIRFKKPDQIPFDLVEELVRKVSVEEWVAMYEREIKR